MVHLDLRPGRLPQPGIGQTRPPRPDQLRPLLLRPRLITRHDPRLDRRSQVLLHRLAVQSQAGRDLTLRPARMPMDQDLGHVDHVETPPRQTHAPVSSREREQPVCCEDRTDDATHVIRVGNYAIANLRNYVIGTPSHLGNSKIADTGPRLATRSSRKRTVKQLRTQRTRSSTEISGFGVRVPDGARALQLPPDRIRMAPPPEPESVSPGRLMSPDSPSVSVHPWFR